MLISLEKLLTKDDYSEEFKFLWEEQSFFNMGNEYPIKKASELVVTVYHDEKKRFSLKGDISFEIEVFCDRCLKDLLKNFEVSVDRKFDLDQIDEEFDDSAYIDGKSIDIGKMITDELVLMWPDKILCKESCKGICKVCGHDLNISDCGCDRVSLDPRMAAIQDIFAKAQK